MSHDGRAVLDFATRKTLVRIGVGFGIAAIILYLVAVGIGTEDLSRAFAGAQLRWLAVGCLSTFVGLVAWGKAWQVVLEVADIREPFRRLVVTYFAATFANYVTPLGQAGGEPFIAYVLSRDTDASYEESLASVVTADLLNLLPFFSFAAVGMGWLLWQANLPTAARPLAMGLLALAVGVPAFAMVGWRFRGRLAAGVLRLVAPVARRTPRLTVAGIRERMRDLGAAFDRIASDPRALARALVFSYVGWVFFAAPLFFAGRTVGIAIGPLLILFIVPASTIAGIVPSPGGLGGVELALTGLLIALVGLSEADAYAVSLVYRVASYWFAILVGGLAAIYVVGRT
ncbi:lysylphosphatidylglycerol synthase transmembrane domain-containing protein [Halorientalis marina]|uniref:lysylphosphatidylglycerol synthase transmembrane domain-containing protein n=1 Tax=Halorientalis marina TaxID=2931976 RepID=UPI001FF27D7F|nr:lysylphosphatidylglycerol synthase transmembrane domain-containing protein [Halorientalis marina]